MDLHVQDVSYQYPDGKQIDFPNFTCPAGEQRLLLGQSGCGKTTLLHLIAGLRKLQKGSIRLGDLALENMKGSLDEYRGQKVGVVFQQAHLIRSLNVEENLLAAQHFAQIKEDKNAIVHLLDRLGLADKRKAKPQQLSQGEQQRIAIARVLLRRPQLILADEPTASLDDKNAEEVAQLLREQSEALNASLLIVTHDARLKKLFPQQILLGQ
ncbi:ABC transporter ATP-binding protein [Saprospira grandis]|uniref:ABC transporter ATP-binding protein n=1 Tax=Saprospira grandis TaxID=1008 RepID=UPI0022DD06DC|nr:ATP-binding cassette domain-containing protein [Saprospira grandis]WBM75531.1 ATP-binding cassette domain-containing protein [Saprospira grandis]